MRATGIAGKSIARMARSHGNVFFFKFIGSRIIQAETRPRGARS